MSLQLFINCRDFCDNKIFPLSARYDIIKLMLIRKVMRWHMLNEDRIKLMTKMASYESKDGKKQIPISKFFRIDFVTVNMLKTAIYATIGFCLLVGTWVLYKADFFMANIHKMNLLILGKSILNYYIAFLAVYLVIAYFVYMIKYNNARRGVKKYYIQLKKLSKLYEKEVYENDGRKSLGGKTDNDHFAGI